MIDSRRTYLSISYNGKNINSGLDEHLKDWIYTDNLSGQIDDLQINLEDISRKWLGSWFPSKGSTLNATIYKQNWKGSTIKAPLGKFEIDEIEAKPGEVKVKALAVSETSSLRGQFKSKAWEKTTLKVVAGDVAKRNGMKLYYQANDNPKKDRYEQEGETDLMFLHRLCQDEGFCLKITNKSIVILDEEDYERASVVATIIWPSNETDETQVLDWSAKTTLSGVYKSCRVEHKVSKKKTIKATYTPPKPPNVGRVLIVKEQVKSVAEAQRLARKRLREANKEATTVWLKIASEKHFYAGNTVNLKGFGKFDGKYIISQASHSQDDTELKLRKCLEGY
ncbi:phage late control D family protein [Bacillus sp. B-jedd]|uniref:phage late control D family protein n=1 Tax=Bacillus sp. B-jedd TaxID=1476857 RepID=UPI0005156D15|nr:contractile injection system protein, VgrG/Pvc8 family [Bacillus sp. B-jedd]CEG29793.1 Phage late control gene D protein (GPD) [Bacillus sp. B-jedd]